MPTTNNPSTRCVTAAQTKEIEVTRLSQDLEARIQQQNFLEDELQGVRAQLAGFTDLDSAVGAGDGVGMDGFEVESVPTLREKVCCCGLRVS